MERAKSIKAKTLDKEEGNNSFPSVLNTDNSTLIEIARLIGVDLGISLDRVEHNLDLIRLQENARVAMFREKEKVVETLEVDNAHLQPEEVDDILKELLALN